MAKAKAKETKGSKKEAPKQEAQKQGGGWMRRGADGFSKKANIDTMLQMRKARMAPRIWLPEGGSKRLVFLDSNPAFIWEHSLPDENGKLGRNFVTCVKEDQPCPLCGAGQRSTYTAYLTVIDVDGYKKKTGEAVTNIRSLYPIKGSTMKVVQGLLDEHKNLSGLAFEVKRLSADDPNCGRDFKFLKKADLSKIKPTDRKPFDYDTILSPPTEDEWAEIGVPAGGGVVGAQGGGRSSSTEEGSGEDLGSVL